MSGEPEGRDAPPPEWGELFGVVRDALQSAAAPEALRAVAKIHAEFVMRGQHIALRGSSQAGSAPALNLQAEVERLERENQEWAASFALYEDANRRGVALWHVSGGDPDVWPDQAKLVAWLLSERDRLEKYVGWLNATLAELRGAGSAGSPASQESKGRLSRDNAPDGNEAARSTHEPHGTPLLSRDRIEAIVKAYHDAYCYPWATADERAAQAFRDALGAASPSSGEARTRSAYEIAREFENLPPDAQPGAFQDLAWRLSQAVIKEPDHPDYSRVCEELDVVGARVAMLDDAVRWALGEIGTFAPRPEGGLPYWWRVELRRRAFGGLLPHP